MHDDVHPHTKVTASHSTRCEIVDHHIRDVALAMMNTGGNAFRSAKGIELSLSLTCDAQSL